MPAIPRRRLACAVVGARAQRKLHDRVRPARITCRTEWSLAQPLGSAAGLAHAAHVPSPTCWTRRWHPCCLSSARSLGASNQRGAFVHEYCTARASRRGPRAGRRPRDLARTCVLGELLQHLHRRHRILFQPHHLRRRARPLPRPHDGASLCARSPLTCTRRLPSSLTSSLRRPLSRSNTLPP